MTKINDKLLQMAATEFLKHESKVKHKDIMVVVDFGIHSSKKRLFVLNRKTGKVIRSHHVAHGRGSDWNNTGYVQEFSNKVMSKKSSKGSYLTGNIYTWGRRFPTRNKLKLHGLDSTNSNVFKRAIVMHSSKYVTDGTVRRLGRIGCSWGCLAVDPAIADSLIDLIQDGTFIYVNSSRML